MKDLIKKNINLLVTFGGLVDLINLNLVVTDINDKGNYIVNLEMKEFFSLIAKKNKRRLSRINRI